MSRLFLAFNLMIISLANASIAELIGKIVFFKIPIGEANLPVVVLWLVVGGGILYVLYEVHQSAWF